MGMAKCKDCKFYGVCILERRVADADVTGCKIYEVSERDFIDAVRCKNCLHRKKQTCFHPYAGIWVVVKLKDDDFCSYGERKDDAEDQTST